MGVEIKGTVDQITETNAFQYLKNDNSGIFNWMRSVGVVTTFLKKMFYLYLKTNNNINGLEA